MDIRDDMNSSEEIPPFNGIMAGEQLYISRRIAKGTYELYIKQGSKMNISTINIEDDEYKDTIVF